MEYNSFLLGARRGLRPTGGRSPVTVIHPPDAIVECSPAGKPLVRGTVFGPAVVVEDVDGATMGSDHITPVSSSVVASDTPGMTYGGSSWDGGMTSEEELERLLEGQIIVGNDLSAYGAKKEPPGGKKEPFGGKKESFGGKKEPFGGKKDHFGGKQEPFGGQKEPFGGRNKPFGGKQEPFGEMKEPFGGKKEPFGGMEEPFGGMKEPFGGKQESFGGQKKPFGGRNEPFSGKKESFGGMKEPFGGMKEPFGGKQEPFGGMKKPFSERNEPFTGKKESFGGQKKPFGGWKETFDGRYAFSDGEQDFKPRKYNNKTSLNGFSDLLMIDRKAAPLPDPTPPTPPPRFSSKASTLPRFKGQKPIPPKRDFHKITFDKYINHGSHTLPVEDNLIEGRRSPIFMAMGGQSMTLPRNMGRTPRGNYRSSLIIPTGRSTSMDPQYTSTLPAAHHSHLLQNKPSRVFNTSPLMRRKYEEDWAYLTTDDEDDVFYPPSEPYVPPIPKETYREIPVVKSSPLPRSMSYDNVFFFKTNAQPNMTGRAVTPASRPIIQATTYGSFPIQGGSVPLQRKPYSSFTLPRKPGYGCPPLVAQRSSSMFAVNRLLSSSEVNQQMMRLTPTTDYVDKGRATSFTTLNTLPAQYTNGRLSPQPYQNGRLSPQPFQNGRLSPQPYQNGRVSPFGIHNGGADTERMSPFPVENGRSSPFPPENGRASPYLSDTDMPFQQVKVISTIRPVSPFISNAGRSSPYTGGSSPYPGGGGSSPHPGDPPRSPSPIRYSTTGQRSPYLQDNRKSVGQSSVAVTSVTPVFASPLSSAFSDPGDDYDNLQTGTGTGGRSLPVSGTTRSAVSVRFQNGNDVGTGTGNATGTGTGTGIAIGTGTGTGSANRRESGSATFLDDYDNLGTMTSSSSRRRVDVGVAADPGGAGSGKVDKAVDNPRFPHAEDQRRTSLVWVKGYSTTMSLGGEICIRCGQGFNVSEEIVKCNGESWHTRCFVAKGENGYANGSAGRGDGDEGSLGGPAPQTPSPPRDGVNGLPGRLVCEQCEQGLDRTKPIVNYGGQTWHPHCFVCAQCFQPFPDGIFYEFEGRKYCEHDFHVLFAPCCGRCREFIVGRVIKAMNSNWHPDCFQCELCSCSLADAGFIKNAGRALCRECNARERALGMGKYVCHKCHTIIDEGHIKYRGEPYHPYHFNCTNCNVELNADAREKGGDLFCLRCHDKMGIPICGACRRPIEERVVHALGKAWHVEHFVCAKCEKPFLGHRHYEKKGLAYCETHYHQLFGNICFVCNSVISGDVFSALNKAWCVHHFACSICDRKMSQNLTRSGLCGYSGGDTVGRRSARYCGLLPGGEWVSRTKFFEFDLKPVCKGCYDHFPGELKKRLKKAYENSPKK